MALTDIKLSYILIFILIILLIIYNSNINNLNNLNNRENFLINIYDSNKKEDSLTLQESLSDLIPCINDINKEQTIHDFTKCRIGKSQNYYTCINTLDAKIENC